MKPLHLIVFLALIFPFVGMAQPKNAATKTATSGQIEAYYFHNTFRCPTCKAVEAETKRDLGALYPDLVKKGKIRFTAMNLQEGSGKVMARKMGVSGQSLWLVKGAKKIDLTSQAFLYARSNPNKLKSIIKEKVDALLAL